MIKKYDNNISFYELIKLFDESSGINITDNIEVINTLYSFISVDSNYKIITYLDKNKAVALLSYTIAEEHLWIAELHIKKEYQDGKVLKKLIKEFYNDTIDMNYDEVYSRIDRDNYELQSVFTNMGFKLKDLTIYIIKRKDLLKWIEV